jgi:hypothetical protein
MSRLPRRQNEEKQKKEEPNDGENKKEQQQIPLFPTPLSHYIIPTGETNGCYALLENSSGSFQQSCDPNGSGRWRLLAKLTLKIYLGMKREFGERVV